MTKPLEDKAWLPFSCFLHYSSIKVLKPQWVPLPSTGSRYTIDVAPSLITKSITTTFESLFPLLHSSLAPQRMNLPSFFLIAWQLFIYKFSIKDQSITTFKVQYHTKFSHHSEIKNEAKPVTTSNFLSISFSCFLSRFLPILDCEAIWYHMHFYGTLAGVPKLFKDIHVLWLQR